MFSMMNLEEVCVCVYNWMVERAQRPEEDSLAQVRNRGGIGVSLQ